MKVEHFRELVEVHDLHGLAFQHLDICARRAWFHLSRIDYSALDTRMQLGSVGHDQHKARDSSAVGLLGLAPDRVDWAQREVLEVKGTGGAARAVASQTVFYALLLMAATGKRWSAANEIIATRRKRVVSIDETEIDRMLDMADRLRVLAAEETPPTVPAIPMCPKCSYRFLCGRG